MGSRAFFKRAGLIAGLVAIPLAALSLGCDLTKVAANGFGKSMKRGAPAFEQHWDYELAMSAMPGNIIQAEGLLRIVPENELILLSTVRLYSGYAFAYLEDQGEIYQDDNDYQNADRVFRRARYMYLRALDLAKHLIGLNHEGMEEAYQGGLEQFKQWLAEEFDDEEDAEPLFWCGYAWGSYINMSKDDMVAVADLPFAKALVERSVALNPGYYNGGGLIFMAVVATEAPGANLDEAEPIWERAVAVTERRNLLAIVNMAKTYAVRRHDRELYVRLLREVIEAGDIFPESRLTNVIAKRRARRYLRRVNRLFPPTPPAPAQPEQAEEPSDEAAPQEAPPAE